jgi:hypothetical protein
MTNETENQKISHEDAPNCCGYHSTAWAEVVKLTDLVGKLIVHCNHKPEGWDELDRQYQCARAILGD